MATLEFKVNLEDEEGIEQIHEMLSCYLNGSRVKDARVRRGIISDTIVCETVEQASEVVADVEPDLELDSSGVKWDPEIHSAGKTKLDDGTWRKKRTVKAKVKDEKPVPPPPPGEGMTPDEVTYKNMMDILKGKGLTLIQMNELAAQVGVASIGLLISQPGLIPAVLALADSNAS